MLSHRTNVLFEEKEWQALAKLAKREGVSVGNLLRRIAKQLVEATEQNDQYQLQDKKRMYVQVRDRAVTSYSQEKQLLPLSFSVDDYEYLQNLAKKKQVHITDLIYQTLNKEYEFPSESILKKRVEAAKRISQMREELLRKGVRVTTEEIIAWKNEGRK